MRERESTALRNVNWARRKILHEEKASGRNAERGSVDRRLRAFRVIDERSYQRIKSAAEVGRSKLKLRLS